MYDIILIYLLTAIAVCIETPDTSPSCGNGRSSTADEISEVPLMDERSSSSWIKLANRSSGHNAQNLSHSADQESQDRFCYHHLRYLLAEISPCECNVPDPTIQDPTILDQAQYLWMYACTGKYVNIVMIYVYDIMGFSHDIINYIMHDI